MIPFPGEPTPDWLTAVLRQSGMLEKGEVISVEISDTGAFNSRTIRLNLGYAQDAGPDAPQRLVLKRNTPAAWSKEAGRDEVAFYTLATKSSDLALVIPPCYAAAYDKTTGDSYILLMDLSATYTPPITRDDQISIIRGMPLPAHQESVIDALARLHAGWWNHPEIGSGIFEVGYWSRDAARFTKYLEHRKTAWDIMIAKEKTWFTPGLIDFYQGLFDALPAYWERALAPRLAARKNMTLIHGDAYFANFLCPKTPDGGLTYLLDWQSPSWDLAAYDLVNLLAAFWTRAQRQEAGRELKLMRRYLEGLHAHGVANYTWDDLRADYQAGLIFWVLMPVQDGADGANKSYWWPKMQCLLDAFEDWQCAELLSRPATYP